MISVCIAAHNGGLYIKKELQSILCQLSPDDEIIISDDGSTDNTIDEINTLDDNRIHIYRYEQKNKTSNLHRLVTLNFENALKHAKGDYIFLADQDDIWHSDKVDKCLKALQNHVLIVHELACVDSNLLPLGKNIYGDGGFRFKNYFILGEHSYFGCAMAFRRTLLKDTMPFPRSLTAHDFWLGLMAESNYSACYISEPLIDYRIHDSNTSSIDDHNIFYSISFRLNLLSNITYRSLLHHL